jgi:signal transduction histidine kinase
MRGWSLRAQLVAAVVTAVALFAAAAAMFTARSYRADRAAAGRDLSRLAGAAAARLDKQVSDAERLVAGLAGQDAIVSLDRDRCQLLLGGFRGLGPGHLVVVGPDDSLLCSSLPAAPSTAHVYADAPWVGAARTKGGPVHVAPVVDPLNHLQSLVLAAPVPAPAGTARPAAVLGAVLDLDDFAPDLVGPLEQARGTVVAAIDPSQTTVLFRSPGRYAGQPVRQGANRTALFEATGLDGIRRVYRQTTARDLGWHIYAGTPAATAFAAARRTVGQSILLTGLVFCMLVLLTALLYRRLVRPTRALTATIVAARVGDDAGPATEAGPAELAQLAVEFNRLQTARADEAQARRAADSALADRMVELAEARAELQRALVRFTQLQEDERHLIAQKIHDDTIQTLIATLWSLDDLDADTDPPATAAALSRVRDNLTAAVAAARSQLFDLRPPALDQLGLGSAVEQQLARLVEETGIEAAFESDVQGRLPLYLETLVFRTVQEALRNVRQHSSATTVRVSLHGQDNRLTVHVEDNGVGVRPAGFIGDGIPHAGIVAMRETITMSGGSFSIGASPPGGTSVSFSLPLGPPTG